VKNVLLFKYNIKTNNSFLKSNKGGEMTNFFLVKMGLGILILSFIVFAISMFTDGVKGSYWPIIKDWAKFHQSFNVTCIAGIGMVFGSILAMIGMFVKYGWTFLKM